MSETKLVLQTHIRNGYALWCRMSLAEQRDLLDEMRPVVEEGQETDPDHALKLLACVNLANILQRQHAAKMLTDLHLSRNRAYRESLIVVLVTMAFTIWGAL